MFLQSSDEEYKSFVVALANGQGNYPRESEAVSLKSCMTPIAFKRLQRYLDIWQSRGDGEAFVCDFSQNSQVRARHGKILPACCKSSTFFSCSRNRFFTEADVMRSQGWPLPSDVEWGDCSHEHALRGCAARAVFGNGQHLMQIGQVFLYMASFSLKKSVALRLVSVAHQLPASDDSQDECRDAGDSGDSASAGGTSDRSS